MFLPSKPFFEDSEKLRESSLARLLRRPPMSVLLPYLTVKKSDIF